MQVKVEVRASGEAGEILSRFEATTLQRASSLVEAAFGDYECDQKRWVEIEIKHHSGLAICCRGLDVSALWKVRLLEMLSWPLRYTGCTEGF